MLKLKARPALLISDMQNCFCHPNGTFSKFGIAVDPMRAVIPAIDSLRAIFRSKNLPVYHIRQGYAEDYSDSGIVFSEAPASHLKEMKALIRHTWDWELVDELTPVEGEQVVEKTSSSAVIGTDLLGRIQRDGVDQVIVVGVGTNVCVETTVRDLACNGVAVKTVGDATATNTREDHEASLRNLQWFGGVTSVQEVEDAFKNYT